MGKKDKKPKITPQEEKLLAGMQIFTDHPLFHILSCSKRYLKNNELGKDCAVKITSDSILLLNRQFDQSPEEWAFCIAHAVMHMAFRHFDADYMPGYRDADGKWVVSCNLSLWNMACDLYIDRFLCELKFGKPHVSAALLEKYPQGDNELALYQALANSGWNPAENCLGTAAVGSLDMVGLEQPLVYNKYRKNYLAANFAEGLSYAVRDALSDTAHNSHRQRNEFSYQMEYVLNRIPLLGAIASGFRILKVKDVPAVHDVDVAAVDVTRGEIYLNDSIWRSREEWAFILAHEFLHAGLQHHARRQGRDPFLWNVACDYVINGWLVEMGVGKMPDIGVLYDEGLKGCSAEEIYDRLVTDLRRITKLKTFRGFGKGDIIADAWTPDDRRYVTLDTFYRDALQSGLEFVQQRGRGLLPAGLVEEIRALSMPPIPWDVKLARWFEAQFPPLEIVRSYARPSRRQSSTPDIPRPGRMQLAVSEQSRTYGVIIDTSGSMPPSSIGLALGAAASYSVERDVPFVRLVFCDAAPTDLGYVTPDEIAGRVEVTGRGGTCMQPAVDLLEAAKDFPSDAPILIITDGEIEWDLRIRHPHAFLIPYGSCLPFSPKGEVFYFKERVEAA